MNRKVVILVACVAILCLTLGYILGYESGYQVGAVKYFQEGVQAGIFHAESALADIYEIPAWEWEMIKK